MLRPLDPGPRPRAGHGLARGSTSALEAAWARLQGLRAGRRRPMPVLGPAAQLVPTPAEYINGAGVAVRLGVGVAAVGALSRRGLRRRSLHRPPLQPALATPPRLHHRHRHSRLRAARRQ